jgi:hypothetical protein
MWTCHTCTFDNVVDHSNNCEVCGEKRKRKKEGAATTVQLKLSVSQRPTVELAPFRLGKRNQPDPQGLKLEKNSLECKRPRLAGASSLEGSSRLKQGTLIPSLRARQNDKSTTNPSQTDAVAKKSWSVSHTVVPEDIPYEALWEDALVKLQAVFGFPELRELQNAAVECALKRQSQLIVMATGMCPWKYRLLCLQPFLMSLHFLFIGGGKSMCYQLPALVLGGVTVRNSWMVSIRHSILPRRSLSPICIRLSFHLSLL